MTSREETRNRILRRTKVFIKAAKNNIYLITAVMVNVLIVTIITNRINNAEQFQWFVFILIIVAVVLSGLLMHYLSFRISEQFVNEGITTLQQADQTISKSKEAGEILNTTVIPSFINNQDRPITPSVLEQLGNSISNLDSGVNQLRNYTKGAKLISRNIVTFGEIGSEMLGDFFNDDTMIEKTISEIRFIGTGRGALGLPNYSYQFCENLKSFMLKRMNQPVFSKFRIIGAFRPHDQFCARAFSLHMLIWFQEMAKMKKIVMPESIEFQIVFPYSDTFPAMLSMGSYKTLIAIPIGFEDKDTVAQALPIGIQMVNNNIYASAEGSSLSLQNTILRFNKHFDERFYGLNEKGDSIYKTKLVPEIWGLRKANQLQFYVNKLNKSAFNRACTVVSADLENEDLKLLKTTFNTVERKSNARDLSNRIISSENLTSLYKLFIKAAKLPDIPINP